MTPQYFRVLQQYHLQFYYKANLEFNLDNSFAIVESLPLTTNEIQDKMYHWSTWYLKLLIRLSSLFTKSYFLTLQAETFKYKPCLSYRV